MHLSPLKKQSAESRRIGVQTLCAFDPYPESTLRRALQFTQGPPKFYIMLIRLILLAFLSVAPAMAAAESHTVRDRIVESLRDDGYSQIRISRTFLGRTRFVATADGRRREIVVTRSGVVLRDYVRDLRDQSGSDSSGGSSSGGSNGNDNGNNGGTEDNGGRSDDDNDDDDSDDSGSGSDDDDGDDDDDNSGSGSSGSSGSSGGGGDDDDDDDDDD